MFSTAELLSLAKSRQGGISDYRLAQLLGIPNSGIGNYKAGRSKPSNPIAARLGELAGTDPIEAACMVNLERSSDDREREFWLSVLSRVKATAPARAPS